MKQELTKILTEHRKILAEATTFDEMAKRTEDLITKALAQQREEFMEMLKDESLNGVDPFYGAGEFEAMEMKIRNQLRAELRQKLERKYGSDRT